MRSPRRDRAAAALAAVALGAGLAGCSSAADQVRAKVREFAQTVTHHDFRELCAQVLAPALAQRIESGLGVSCEQGVSRALSGVSGAKVSIGAVAVHGRRATADVLTMARGEEAAIEGVELIRTGSGWRISSLGSPVVPKAHKRH
jgi:hypothetical protein